MVAAPPPRRGAKVASVVMAVSAVTAGWRPRRDWGLDELPRPQDKYGRDQPERQEVVMSVYRVIDVIGTSSSSWEEAAAEAIKTAGGSVRDLRVAEVTKQDVVVGDDGALVYRTKVQLSFKYESE
jgi:flavin-binding protein dodecin